MFRCLGIKFRLFTLFSVSFSIDAKNFIEGENLSPIIDCDMLSLRLFKSTFWTHFFSIYDVYCEWGLITISSVITASMFRLSTPAESMSMS